ncbi:MAG: hypothetical protein EBX40_07695, partial [Gammaproteobacteria bacterium]|nr:hypothetical protein [Gammaproteobacteria bacterium]
MYTLGIGDVTHDVSVFLLKDQTVLVGIEAERLNRIKHGLRLDPTRYLIVEQHLEIQAMLKKLTLEYRTQALLPLIEYCLKAAQIKWSEIDQIVVSSLFDTHPYAERALALPHHLAHAASTFYTSPFEKAAILAIDGYGTVRNNTSEAIVFGAGSHLDISMIHTIRGQFETTPEEAKKHGSLNSHMIFSNSLGVFYQNITLLLGLGYHGEGKTMGLAAYGKPNSLFESLRDAIIFEPDGTLQIHNRQIFLQCKNWLETARDTLSPSAFFQYKADLALTHQTLLETMIFHLCRGLYERTGLTHLCLAGGVALNSVANGKITAHTPFKHVFIPPPAGDNGIALGAALYGVHAKARLPRISHSAFSPYVGRHYSEIEIQNALSTYERKIQATPLLEEAPKKAAELLNEGKILAWFDGGSEVGPRALGNRSILADPR